MTVFFFVKTTVLFEIVESSRTTRVIEYFCFLSFIPLFAMIIKDLIGKTKDTAFINSYSKKINASLIKQSYNELFYMGNTIDGAKSLTAEIVETIEADRASIWLYNKEKTSIVCQQLYVRSENTFYDGIEIFEKDFPEYFEALINDPIIVADNAETHPSTRCFKDAYLKPLGIKSMLDVPIWYKGSNLGVICIENLKPRKWGKIEVNFAQILSSLYSFAYSMQETNDLLRRIGENENFIDKSCLVSIADSKGKITYVNEKFTQVSGWSLSEAYGKDHNIVNSGLQPEGYWGKMYEVVLKGGIWNDVVVNRAKNGELYYVDTYIRAIFDSSGSLEGFHSIRQDVTEVKKKEMEIRNRMNAINKSNAVIEFDLDGNIMFANDLFVKTMEYDSFDEIKGKNHRIFVKDEDIESEQYKQFWKSLKNGNYFSGKCERIKKNGDLVHLQSTYNPILSTDETPYRIMKISTDITEAVNQKSELEKKNTYLEHAAKILRHDMHSGINTYMPRGLGSLERRLKQEDIESLKIEAPIKMIKEGLRHSQKVYKGVYEFTNLVKKDVVLNREECNLKEILQDYLSSTAYHSQVIISDLPTFSVNEPLFCTAVDNLIRNGLKYNDSETKFVKIYFEEDTIYIQDNGRGITQEDFNHLSKPYTRKEGQKESGTGLGLNICVAILEEHGFKITCEKNEIGTRMKIKIK
jgi:PAS domain S-box-containing protein